MTALLTDNLPLLAGAPNSIKKLRELILELAVRGKLVPQDPNDEPASELLKRIAEEKARLVAERKINKQKPQAAIAEEERPYDLPDTWAWVRLPDVYYPVSVSGNKLLSSQISEEGIFPVVDQGKRFVAGYTDDKSLLIRLPGPVVVFGDHTTERKYVDFDFVAGADGVKILRPVLLDEKFFWWHLVGLKLEGRGYARHFKILNDAFFALPPKGEQSRIVAKVDELMALCDCLEAQQADAESAHAQLVQALLGSLTQAADSEDFATSWQRLAEHFPALFTTESSIDALKQTLLQLAVMGKLVPQDPNDEPATELLNHIIEDKIRAASLNRKRQVKEVVDNSSDGAGLIAPRGWVKSTVGAVTICRDGERIPVAQAERAGRAKTYDYYGASGVIDKIDDYLFDKPLLLVGEDGANLINRSTPIAYMARGKYWVNNHAHVLDGISESLLLYVCLYFNAIDLKPYVTGTAQPKMNQAKMNAIPLLLPPEAEQHRIVAKVDQLMALCDQLKARLAQARQLNEQLATALVEQAVA